MYTAIVIRPGRTEFDSEGRIQGAIDLPMNEAGRDEVAASTEQVRASKLDVIYASPSEPSLSTAKQIGKTLGVPVKTLDQLENVDLGLWQGMLYEDLKRSNPRVFKQWEEHPESICPPQGEPMADVVARLRVALGKPMKKGGVFGVVASEPLASLICSILKSGVAALPGPICGCGPESERVEIFTCGEPTDVETAQTPQLAFVMPGFFMM